jgi:hypothetical protein
VVLEEGSVKLEPSLPLSTTLEAFEATIVRVEELPVTIPAGFAVIVTVGAGFGTTVTVVLDVAVPPGPVAVAV